MKAKRCIYLFFLQKKHCIGNFIFIRTSMVADHCTGCPFQTYFTSKTAVNKKFKSYLFPEGCFLIRQISELYYT
jgi:hypothetical protein